MTSEPKPDQQRHRSHASSRSGSSGSASSSSRASSDGSRKHRRRSDAGSSAVSWWLHAFDVCLALALLVPFVLGGRIAYGELTLILSAVGCSLCWAAHQLTRDEPICIWTKAELLLAAIVGVGLIQLVPLPTSVIELLSPQVKELLPLWDGAEDSFFGSWNYLSFSVGESRRALVIGVAYVLLFWLTAQRIRKVADVERLLRAVCVAAAVMAGFGLIQFLTSNGKFYWFFEFPAGTTNDHVKGAFANKNHFAAFLTLAVGPFVWWLMNLSDSTESEEGTFGNSNSVSLPKSARLGLIAIGGALVAVGLLSSRSRGAFVSASAGLSVMLVVLYLRSMISARVMGGLVAMVAVAIGLQFVIGYEKALDRLNRWDDNGRAEIWQANLDVIADFPIAGTGVGSHRYAHLRYLDRPYNEHEYTHAESNYLQVTTETGAIGLCIAVACLCLCFYWCCRGIRVSQSKGTTVALLSLLASLIANTVHSLFDFTWYIPGYMVVFVLQMACACRLYQLARDQALGSQVASPKPIPQVVFAVALLGLVALSTWMIRTEWPSVAAEQHWLTYRRLTFNAEVEQEDREDSEAGVVVDEESRQQKLLTQKLKSLRAAASVNPHDPRVQLRLMRHYLLIFTELQKNSENPLPLSQIRDAALNSEFASQEEMFEWLNRSVGSNIKYARSAYQHGLNALRLNPLQFHGYLDLSELAFLGSTPPNFSQRCIEQALTLAPNDGHTLFAAGREAWLRQEEEVACTHWKRAFHRSRGAQFSILQIMANVKLSESQTQTEVIVKLFEPDIDALDRLALIQSAYGLVEDSQRTLLLLAGQLTERASRLENPKRVTDWLRAGGTYERLQQFESADNCYVQALELSPSNYQTHLDYGLYLYRQRRGIDAREQLKWCQNQREDSRVAKLLERIQHGQFPMPVQQATVEQPADGTAAIGAVQQTNATR